MMGSMVEPPSRTRQEKRVASIVRDRRQSLGLTQAGLSDATGIHRVTIARIETGKYGNLGLSTAQQLAHTLGISVAELVQPYRVESGDYWAAEFESSPWCATLNPTEDELQWLRNIPDWILAGVRTTPEAIAKLLMWRRENHE
jgi:transcriptional regulator with XRE-family HTH domain